MKTNIVPAKERKKEMYTSSSSRTSSITHDSLPAYTLHYTIPLTTIRHNIYFRIFDYFILCCYTVLLPKLNTLVLSYWAYEIRKPNFDTCVNCIGFNWFTEFICTVSSAYLQCYEHIFNSIDHLLYLLNKFWHTHTVRFDSTANCKSKICERFDHWVHCSFSMHDMRRFSNTPKNELWWGNKSSKNSQIEIHLKMHTPQSSVPAIFWPCQNS